MWRIPEEGESDGALFTNENKELEGPFIKMKNLGRFSGNKEGRHGFCYDSYKLRS